MIAVQEEKTTEIVQGAGKSMQGRPPAFRRGFAPGGWRPRSFPRLHDDLRDRPEGPQLVSLPASMSHRHGSPGRDSAIARRAVASTQTMSREFP